ncbi:MAG: vWA domain-containing protein [Myxococcota bacterium]
MAWPGSAAADEVWGTRSERLVERSHDIRLVLDHGVATLRVRRAVHNGGERHDQALFWIDVPETAVATGLRTRGMLHGKPHWFEGDLLEAELAAQRYTELTGIGGYYPKDPALLSWRNPTLLALQVFPVAPQTEKMVEYTLQMPTVYEEGRDHLDLPPLGTEKHPARVTLKAAHRRDQLFVRGEPVGHGTQLTLDQQVSLSLARARTPRIEAHLASVPFADQRVLMHLDVALAPKLSTIPRNARVVVVLDGSRSMSEGERKAEVATARATLEHFAAPKLGAKAEVLVFDHKVEGRNGGLVSVRKAIADLEHLELPGNNGSHVDQALTRAGELLAGSKGPRRIVLLTDARTRDGLKPARLRTLAEDSRAIVHVGIVGEGSATLQRDDSHPWAEATTTTGGLVWNVAADLDGDRQDHRAVFEELARPVRLDHVRVLVPPLADEHVYVDESMVEGEGVDAFELVTEPIAHLRVEGELWSTPVHETVFAEDEDNRRWAALVFGSELLGELSEEEMMPLAILGGAVSPVTSYLAIEPGVRPSTEGLDETEGMGMIGFGAGGGSGSGTIGQGSVGLIGGDSRPEFLRQAVRDALDDCAGPGRAARVVLESTLDEIVHLDRITIVDSTDPTLTRCVETQLWDLELRRDFNDEWRRWVVDVPAT